MVAQQNQIRHAVAKVNDAPWKYSSVSGILQGRVRKNLDQYVLMIPSLLVAKSGASLSPENLLKNRFIIVTVDNLAVSVTAGSPPTKFSTSSDNHVLRLFL